MSASAKSAPMATEAEWPDSIAAAASCERQAVEDVLRQHGIKAQSSVPRARQVSFTSVSFAGMKEETDGDGPFSFDWSNLGPGFGRSDRRSRRAAWGPGD